VRVRMGGINFRLSALRQIRTIRFEAQGARITQQDQDEGFPEEPPQGV
jgi:hypothetical protein